MAEPDALGALRAGGEKYFRGRGVRVFLQEMVLDLPGVFDAELVGELDLIERILEQLELGPLGPWPGQLVLVENAELHGMSLYANVLAIAGVALIPAPAAALA